MEFISQFGFNSADLIVVVIMLMGLLLGMRKGLVGMAVKVIYSAASFAAAFLLYPVISSFVRKTSMFDMIKAKLLTSLGLESAVQTYTKQQEINMISALRLPDQIKDKLVENNNSVIYDLLGADNFVDYVVGFAANIIINVFIVAVIFGLFMLALRIILGSIEMLAKLPVIGSLNRLGGAIMGVTLALIIVWVLFSFVLVFIANESVYSLYEYIQTSRIAMWLYNNNLLFELVLKRLF